MLIGIILMVIGYGLVVFGFFKLTSSDPIDDISFKFFATIVAGNITGAIGGIVFLAYLIKHLFF